MNLGQIIQIIRFLVLNWKTIKDLVAALMDLFGGDSSEVKKSLDGLKDAANKLPRKDKNCGLFGRKCR